MKQRIAMIALVGILVLACAALAQSTGPCYRTGGADRAFGRVVKELGLSNEQIQSIVGIVKQFRTDAKEVFKSSATKEEKKSKIMALKEAAGQSILAVLDADQRAKAEKTNLVEKLLSRRMAGRGWMLAKVLTKLDLSDAQKTAIKAIMQEHKTVAKSIREDSSLTPEAKKAQLQELRQDTLQQVKAELNADQLQKLEELMKKCQNLRGRMQGKNT
jgi:hypothetical protein